MLAIIGAGIGGLAAAIAAHRAGIDVRVYERSNELREIGAGMTLWPNAVRVLDELGVLDELSRVSSVFEHSQVGDLRGRPWTRMCMGEVGRQLGYPTRLVARAALHRILAERARSELGADAIQTSRPFVGLRQDADGVSLSFAGADDVRCEIAIGADGAASRVRQELFGQSEPVFHGRTSFRGLCRSYALPDDSPDFVERHGPKGRFAFYRVGEGAVAWYANVLARVAQDQEPWSLLNASFGTWAAPVPEIISRSSGSPVHVAAISDIEPLPRWTVGRVGLLGDAAHPMTPDLGQGAAQALEDAAALGEALRAHPLEAALAIYETQRRERAVDIVLGSRKTGRIANFRGQTGLLLRRALWSLLPPRTAIARMTAVVGGPNGQYARRPQPA